MFGILLLTLTLINIDSRCTDEYARIKIFTFKSALIKRFNKNHVTLLYSKTGIIQQMFSKRTVMTAADTIVVF